MPDPRPEDTPDAGTRPLPTPPAEDSTHTAGTAHTAGTGPARGPQAADPGPHTPATEAGTHAAWAEAAGAEPPAGPGGGIPPSHNPPPPGHTGFPPPGRSSAVGRFARHRATQLVAVGLLGLVLGGGIVSMVDHDRGHDRRGGAFERPGHSRMDDRGPARER
ncbi:hypothetical protein AB0A74_02245 [Saccharothrix sp. NPDC042600]|uniref:hypothetical protein n=1 Tax=Saccharothrix TaxID=2071 RepID=UPI00341139E9|nr:hypothetical protein GCM10017745_65980 [Saccharothrix mutabilis subsp. capreolus]